MIKYPDKKMEAVNWTMTNFTKQKMIAEKRTFKEIYDYLKEERMNEKKNYYHVSPEPKLILKNEQLFVATRFHGLYTYDFAARDSVMPTAWKLRANYPLDIFNFYNPSDYDILREKLSDSTFRNKIKLTKNNQLLLDIMENIHRNKEYFRDHDLMGEFRDVLELIGYDGYAEDSFIDSKNKQKLEIDYFSKGALCIFDAKKSLFIVEQLDSELIGNKELKLKAIKAGQVLRK